MPQTKVLVTGAGGFIGHHLVTFLRAKGYWVRGVDISNHIWIAPHVVILKGVHIGEDSVVATGSVLTESCESGVIVGGNPAKVIKTGVSWRRERIPPGVKA